ncbi:MAG: tetratricopeptide repeat protein [Acidiferrobacterales bacterium]
MTCAAIKLSQTIASSKGTEGSFSAIAGITMSENGTLYLTDNRSGRLVRFGPSGSTSIALAGQDRVFKSGRLTGAASVDDALLAIANAGDSSVAIIDEAGRPRYSFGGRGSDDGQLDAPVGLAYSPRGRFYVADSGNDRISVYSGDGIFLFSFGDKDPSGKTNLKKPVHVGVDIDENIYVLDDYGGDRISVYDHTGTLLKRISSEELRGHTRKPPKLTAMTVSLHGEIFLADGNNGKILQLDWRAGQIANTFGSKGKGRGQFSRITALAVTPLHQLVVGDVRNKKIEIYDLIPSVTRTPTEDLRLPSIRLGESYGLECDKAYPMPGDSILCLSTAKRTVTRVSRKGKVVQTFEGPFKNPMLAATDDNDVIVVDGNRLKVYSHDGKQRFAFGGSGSKDGHFKQITGVYLRDRIYVADTGKRVQIFSRDGVFLDKLASRKGEQKVLRNPGPVAVDTKGNLYVADSGSSKIRVFSPKKKLLYELGEGAKSPNRYRGFSAMTLDQDDNLYVLASTTRNARTVHVYQGKNRVFSFGSSGTQRGALSDATSLTVLSPIKTEVSIYDKRRQALQTFQFLQVPTKVDELRASGGVGKTKLRWHRVPGSFIDHYSLYAAVQLKGPYEKILETAETTVTVTHDDDKRYVYYRVAAVSGFEVEGVASQVAEDLFQAAYGLYETKQYAEAAELFAQLYDADAQHGEALEFFGLSLLGQKKYEDALRRFRALAKIPGFEIRSINRQTESLFASRQFIAARAMVDKAISQNQVDALTYLWCGRIAMKLGDAAGAADCLASAIKLDEDMVSAHALLGQAYLTVGATDKGLAQLDKALDIAPENPVTWVQSGLAYQSLGRHEEALSRFNKALAIDKLNGAARLGAAQSYFDLKDYEQARSIALSMSGVPAQEAAGQYLLGIIELARGQPQEAALSLTKAANRDPENVKAWLALTEAYLQLEDDAKARSALRQAIAAGPASFEAHFRLGMLEQRSENHIAAARALATAVTMQPAHYESRYAYAVSLLALEGLPEASEHAKRAARLLPKSSDALVLLADIAQRQGKEGDAINYLKKALARNPTSAVIEIELGKRYLENNIFDLAQIHLEQGTLKDTKNAVPHALLGQLFLKRRLYDQAIEAFTKAVELDASEQNRLQLNIAFAEKKKSLELPYHAPLIALQDLRLHQVFAAAYKRYTNEAVGSIKVANTGETEYKDLKLTFHIKDYMDFPTSRRIERLKANDTVEVSLFASFNNRILDIDEDTGLLVEVKLNFYRNGKQDSIDVTQPMTIYGKNAIVWRDLNMVGSFVTPKDETLKDFVRQAINNYRPESGSLNDNIVSAMTWFNVLSAHGMKYVVDPNSPFPELTKDQVDYVQFPRETLWVKSGDCDDLSVLLSAGLENLGIETALVDIPGHLFFMFNSGLSQKDKNFISLQDDLMIIRDGEVWIPLETTMIATSFSEAWAEGARKYNKWKSTNELREIPLKHAWQKYFPVTLPPAKYALELANEKHAKTLIDRERSVLVTKSLERFIVPYRAMLESDPNDLEARMQIGITYAKNGLYDLAVDEFERALQIDPNDSAVHNNHGNIYYIKGDYERALEAYRRAEEFDPQDAGIKVNLALTHYRLGRLADAVAKHAEAIALDKAFAEKYETLQKLLTH